IELMIVIAIISILASIIVPNITRARARAQLTACMSNIKAIQKAMLMRMTDLGPAFDNTEWADLVPDYMGSIPSCPANGEEYDVRSNKNDCATWICAGHCDSSAHADILAEIYPSTYCGQPLRYFFCSRGDSGPGGGGGEYWCPESN
ncbi:MAG: hypothetical protein ACLFQV_03380, partial [Vulcanimicrobiota bacterium]